MHMRIATIAAILLGAPNAAAADSTTLSLRHPGSSPLQAGRAYELYDDSVGDFRPNSALTVMQADNSLQSAYATTSRMVWDPVSGRYVVASELTVAAAITAQQAERAASADTAITAQQAGRATTAGSADYAGQAGTAGTATWAQTAASADTAVTAQQAGRADTLWDASKNQYANSDGLNVGSANSAGTAFMATHANHASSSSTADWARSDERRVLVE